ncbi:MAG: N-acetyltransferase, partial [Alphaproteobacteria bacterium]|nr:N-acetyltransferase [Alphaproteobacteria bacterium]
RIALPGNVALFRRHGFTVVAETCHAGFTSPTSYDMELRL